MRRTEASGWMVRNSPGALSRALRLAVISLGIGLVVGAGAARAEDDEDGKTFEEKIIEGIMTGIGGTNMDNRGIEYRERSPLVVPPKLDLPPPASSSEVKAPNWPKDPDEARRKAAIAARKKDNKDPREASRILLGLLVEAFVPDGPLILGIDETLERRRGKKIAAKGNLYALEFQGRRYDAGNKLEFLQATVDLALERADLGPAFRSYLEDKLRQPVTR